MLSSSERPKLLFVAGCQRSGTTAFAEYLNEHPAVLLGLERYRGLPARELTPELFTFDRILDQRDEETVRPREYYVELLSRKVWEKLRWIGDKNPNYVLRLDALSENCPEARFIILYRRVEEVAESWELEATNPGDPWRGRENGFERGIEAWNVALRRTREFVEARKHRKVLIVPYHDFFYRNAACAALLSRFLDLDFDERIRRKWREFSASFEGIRREKRSLTEAETEFIEKHKDGAAERWVLDRIDAQWGSLKRDEQAAEEMVRSRGGEPYGLAAAAVRSRAVAEDEAERARYLERRVAVLEDNIAKEIRKAGRLKRQRDHLEHQVLNLRGQIRAIQGSRSWKLLETLNRYRTKAHISWGKHRERQ